MLNQWLCRSQSGTSIPNPRQNMIILGYLCCWLLNSFVSISEHAMYRNVPPEKLMTMELTNLGASVRASPMMVPTGWKKESRVMLDKIETLERFLFLLSYTPKEKSATASSITTPITRGIRVLKLETRPTAIPSKNPWKAMANIKTKGAILKPQK